MLVPWRLKKAICQLAIGGAEAIGHYCEIVRTDENRLPVNSTSFDHISNVLLIAVHLGCVYVPDKQELHDWFRSHS